MLDITENFQVDCRADYPMYTTEKPKTRVLLATLTLIVTAGLEFGYAMGDTPEEVNLTDFVAPKRDPVHVPSQWMHGVELCGKPAFTIVSNRLKSDTKPSEILNS